MRRSIFAGLFLLFGSLLAGVSLSQMPSAQQTIQQAADNAPTRVALTLTDALKRAKENSPAFQEVLTELGLAQQDRVQARAALLPSVNYLNQYIYTQGNETPSGRFIANNAVHEYVSQGTVHESVSVSQIADYRKSGAALALAKAKAEIAARGLVATVVESYYSLAAAQRKSVATQQALEEARRFLEISRKLEQGGEVAHSDVIKAQLQEHDRDRDVQEAVLALDRERLDLAVLLFPNFNQDFDVVDDMEQAKPLATFSEAEALAKKNNPELNAALAALKEADEDLLSARSGYLPTFSFDYFYGIDAARFATRTDGIPNLGSSAIATLNIPLFNWGATRSRVKQADLKRQQVQRELSFAQRKILADLRGLYAEAKTASDELALLTSSADLAKESLHLTTMRYQGGEASVLEVVDAQNTLTQAREAQADGFKRYRVALANLQTLTGNF